VSLVQAILIAAVIAGILGFIAVRDHKAMRGSRRGLLDRCLPLFDRYTHKECGDSFPQLSGRVGDQNVDVRLICDTMTMRRLPQLWLQVTVLHEMQGITGFAVLVRPSNYEFYSMTGNFDHVIEPPPSFPSEVIVRADGPYGSVFFDRLAPTLAVILADPKVKEIAVTRRGIRIIRQAAEGRRGEHLLLRQAVFDHATVEAETLGGMLADIRRLQHAVTPKESVPA
jgi:hypothetical protein